MLRFVYPILAATLVAVLPSQLSAFQDLCGFLDTGCLGGEFNHHFVEDFEHNREFEGQGFHGECLVCMVDDEPVDPEVCHPACFETEEEQDYQQDALAQISQYARVGDVRGVLATARELLPQSTRVNHERGAIQVLDCAGAVVVSVPLGPFLPEASRSLRAIEATDRD